MENIKRKRSKQSSRFSRIPSNRSVSKDEVDHIPTLGSSKTPTKRQNSRWLPSQPNSLNDIRSKNNTSSPFGNRQISRSSRFDESYRQVSPKQDKSHQIIRKMKLARHKMKMKMSEINENLTAQDGENDLLENKLNSLAESFELQIDDQTSNEIVLNEHIAELTEHNEQMNIQLRKVLEFAEQIVNLATQTKVGLLSNKWEELDEWASKVQSTFEDKIDSISISLRNPEYQDFIERLHEDQISSKLDLNREVNHFSFQTEGPVFNETAHFKKFNDTDVRSISPEDTHPPL